jgi:hypothetical protein
MMRRCLSTCWWGCLLWMACPLAAQPFDFIKEVESALAAGGGEVVVPPGEYTLTRTIRLTGSAPLEIAGYDKERCVLRLARPRPTALAEPAPAAAPSIRLLDVTDLRVGDGLVLQPDSSAPAQQIRVEVVAMVGDTVALKEPLPVALALGTRATRAEAESIFQLAGDVSKIRIRKLTLDGERQVGQAIQTLSTHGSLAAASEWEVSDCILENFTTAGLHLAAVDKVSVERCSFQDISGPAVILAEATRAGLVRHNHFIRCAEAVRLDGAVECTVLANEVWNGESGIRSQGDSKGHQLLMNQFFWLKGPAIQLGEATAEHQVRENEVEAETSGSWLIQGQSHVVEGNGTRAGTAAE